MGESKQVKVDNWGIFFLQRLQTFFNKTYFCDLTLQFEDNVQLKVHRLVMNACTEYFQVLEQSCEVINDCLIMPPDLQADVVVPIVNFMYTGILEYQMSIFDRLYSTARLMNMTVLTKLLDAQKVPILPITKPINKRSSISPVTWNLQGKKITPKTMDPDLPEPLPGRKLPIWKRKSVPSMVAYRGSDISLPDPLSVKYFRTTLDDTPKPTRFEWPEDDETSFDSNSFDEISYTSKPLLQPQREKSPKPSTSNFEELKRSSVPIKRSASPIYNDNKKVNIQDVKEYIKEQKLRSDYIDYDDSEAADNDLQTYENDNDSEDDVTKEETDEFPNKSILKNDSSTPRTKRVRFSLEGKENTKQKSETSTTIKTNVDMSNHTKIITEVLKKYPHLVKKNKNIRLKILAKGGNASGLKPVGTPIKVVKPASKVSYMVMKPEQGNGKTANSPAVTKIDGHWSCHRCSNPNPLQFETYYLYRKHLTEVHNEKTDSQMCNICGHTSRKQNMLMYHKYIKHNINPPPSYHFPKCNDCPYVALSPTLLTKHRINHIHQNLVCAECSTPFPTKMALISHIQLTGHSDKANCPTFDCGYCAKKFISDETLFQHIKNHHREEARRDNILSQADDEEIEIRKENIITAEEIDALEDQEETLIIPDPLSEKPKDKIKILSDVKVTTPIQGGRFHPIKFETIPKEEPIQTDNQPLEPSSEAESLSNVASGIAASLGLVNTIVVLDDNRFILQSQETAQENIQAESAEDFILSDNINMENLVSQHEVITADNNAIISQATLNKNNITSTDELVMVLTDHDYSDAANNAVITSENSNIVVLYSHPVQNQDGQFISQPGNLMLNSDMSLVEVSSEFAVANTTPNDNKRCEESIELIQQEINNHLEGDSQIVSQTEKIVEEEIIDFEETKPEIISLPNLETNAAKNILVENAETEKMNVDEVKELHKEQEEELSKNITISTNSPEETITEEKEETAPVDLPENIGDNHFEEPMEIEESIEMIQQEINKNTTELQTVTEKPENIVETSEDNLQDLVSLEDKSTKEVTTISEETQIVIQSVEQPTLEKEETERNEVTKENVEETNENIQEDEQMEVDSAKQTENDNELSTETEQTELTNATEVILEKSDTENNISDEIVADSEEETSQNSEMHSLQDESVYESEKEIVFQTTEISQEIHEKPTDENEKQDDSRTEEHENVSELPEQETIKSVQEEAKEVDDTVQTNESSTQDNQDIEKSPENEVLKETENKTETIQENDKEEFIKNPKISNLLDDWDDGDTDSQQSDISKPLVNDNKNSINTLINDWEDEEES